MFSLTNLFGKAMTYLVIALWKLEKPIVRKAPSGAFRYFIGEFLTRKDNFEEKMFFDIAIVSFLQRIWRFAVRLSECEKL